MPGGHPSAPAPAQVVIDAATGQRRWHFQFVHHDLWDRDPPAPPNLVRVKHHGKSVDAVAQVTKAGLVFVFNRETGEPSLRRTWLVKRRTGPDGFWNLAAVAAGRECLLVTGHSADIDWQNALATFPGLAHRMEEIGRTGKVLFINDSKATNADSTEKALLSFPRDVYWIAGGKAKEGGIAPLAPLFGGVAKAYLIGESADQFAETLAGKVPFSRSGTLEAAVQEAARDALASDAAEPVVLLSPACASYDQFKNFEVRGDAFRSLVSGLPGVALRGRT